MFFEERESIGNETEKGDHMPYFLNDGRYNQF